MQIAKNRNVLDGKLLDTMRAAEERSLITTLTKRWLAQDATARELCTVALLIKQVLTVCTPFHYYEIIHLLIIPAPIVQVHFILMTIVPWGKRLSS